MTSPPSTEPARAALTLANPIEFPEALPVSGRRKEIAQAIARHPVVIVCGETGSGKTTQLPKIALTLGRGLSGRSIAHTQPRRLAAVTVARRIAQELGSECGGSPDAVVGYQVRFNDRSRPGIPVKLMTDGILLAQTQNDPTLSSYDTIIVDEAHERSLNIDFLLGYLKNLLPARPDLRVVITSATIDSARFAQHFSINGEPAPVIEVSGRLYPVELRYRPPAVEQDLIESVVAGVEECERDWDGQGPGDILVFLPGEREIKAVADELRGRSAQSLLAKSGRMAREILPLYARLSQADQERVFRPSGARRVVLATNVAETSLTVPGIRYVVDSGLSRVKRYRYRGKVEQLQIEPIPQAQANQRAGRCGRLSNGVCIRLYEEGEFLQRPPFADPEIHRSSLAAVMLRMKALHLPDIRSFPFIDPPSGKAIADGQVMLRELNAIDASGHLTAIGRSLAQLPVDPRIGRMIVAARAMGALKEVLVIAAALSTQDPRERPADQAGAADQAHAKYADPRSEFRSILKLWDRIQLLQAHATSNRKVEQALRAEFLSPLRAREWREVHQQLSDWIAELTWKPNEKPATEEALHQSVLAGLLSNVGCRAPDEPIWQGTHDVKFLVWPGSYLAKKPPRWLMAAEQVETSRLFARTIAAIEPEWIERVGGHLLKRSHAEPHWEKKSGRVVGFERATLYGLTVIQRRKVSWAGLGAAQQQEAREIFIRQALVAGDWDCPFPFFRRNQRLIAEIEALEHKARRPDILVDDELLVAFYDQYLPADVVDSQSFGNWYSQASRSDADLLVLSKDELMRHEAAGITTEQFPRQLVMGDAAFALDYHFAPGDVRDGLTLVTTPEKIAEIDETRIDWLVPGMLREKVLALLKSLPQKIRRHCVPLPDFAAAFCDRWQTEAGTMPLIAALIKDITEQTGVAARRDDFKLDGVPVHCWMNIRVVDSHGRMLQESRDLASLRQELGVEDHEAAKSTAVSRHKDVLFDRFAAAMKEQLKALEKELLSRKEIQLGYSGLGSADMLLEQLRRLAIERAFMAEPLPVTDADFSQRLAQGRSRVLLLGQETLRWLSVVLVEYAAVAKKIPAIRAHRQAHDDLSAQLKRLMPADFIAQIPAERMGHLPRYLKAISSRIDKLKADPSRDARLMAELASVEVPFWRWASQQRGAWSDRMVEFRWMLEELRVSLFAQELKTPMPVSVKRLARSWEKEQ